MKITPLEFPPRNYLVKRQKIHISDITDEKLWETTFREVHAFAQEHKLEIKSYGSALYFSMDHKTNITDFGIGYAVEGNALTDKTTLSLIVVPQSNAITTTMQGGYEQFKKVHQSMWKHCEDHSLKRRMPVIEEYEITAMDTPKEEEWKTNIFYLHK